MEALEEAVTETVDQSTSTFDERTMESYRVAFGIWWLITKNMKLVGLYKRSIWDVCFLPLSILFGHFHNFIKF